MLTTHCLYTVGHSSSDWSDFVNALRKWDVTLLLDIRSRPRSLRFPHFSQPEFEQSLREASLAYLFLGEELGGRPEDPKAYRPDGVVDYRERRKSFGFQAGIERVLSELKHQDLALLCAEEDPLECHRFLMVCPELVTCAVQPQHIRKGGRLERQSEAEDRLLAAHHFGDVASDSLFAASADRAAALEEAYIAQAERCAFRADPQAVEYW